MIALSASLTIGIVLGATLTIVGIRVLPGPLLRRPQRGPRKPVGDHDLERQIEEMDPLTAQQKRMLQGILSLDRISVDDIMIPRHEVAGLDLAAPIETLTAQVRSTPHTHLPVYERSIDQIVGILHMRQIAALLADEPLTRSGLERICEAPYFVPEGTPLATQLVNFQVQQRRIGVVVNEYGDAQGIVTLEDLLAEIVGDLDATDPAQNPDVQRLDDGSYRIDGAAYLREVNQALGWHLPVEGPRTFNGLITEALEQIPDSSVCLQLEGYRMEILEARENRVCAIRVWPPSANQSARPRR